MRRRPPRTVPTLTAVIEWPQDALPAQPGSVNVDTSCAHEAPQPPSAEDQLLQRVRQRLDTLLEHRLHAAVAEAMTRQLDALVPQLRQQLQGVLHEAVADALTQELSESAGAGSLE